jgi:hypothetical protein
MYLKKVKEITKKVYDNQSPGQDLNLGRPECETVATITRPSREVKITENMKNLN